MDIVECRYVTKPYPPELIDASRELLAASVAQIGGMGQVIVQMLVSRFPDHAEKIEESALELGVASDDLFLGSVIYDLAMAFGCSTMALATSDGPLIARNMDWFPETLIARASCILDTDNGKQAGFVGAIGVVTGLSKNGFAFALNAVPTTTPKLDGYPMLLFLRQVLDKAKDFDDALRWIEREPLASGGLITLVGMKNNERAVIERAPTKAVVRRPIGEEPLITTNDYRLMEKVAIECPRHARLSETVKDLGVTATVESMLERLTDERVIQTITAQHVIAHPTTQTLRMWVPKRLLAM